MRKECVDDHAGQADWALFFLLPVLTTPVCLDSQPFVKIFSASTGLMDRAAGGGREQGVICHCREMLPTAGLALLPAAPAARAANLEKCRARTSKNIHSPSQLADHGEISPDAGLTPPCLQLRGPTGSWEQGAPQEPNPCPGQPPPTTVFRGLGLKFSEMPSKPLLSPLTLISRLLSTIRLQPRWPIIIKL